MKKRIGQYDILGELGRGGMGIVYRALHGETGQLVALKTVLNTTGVVLESIRREIKTIARLNHPGIIRIYAEGIQDKLPWYAMEIIQGPRLPEFFQRPGNRHTPSTKAQIKEVLTVIRQVCLALAYLHGEGIVHKDLKPENIVMKSAKNPILMDFGVTSRFGGKLNRERLEIGSEGMGTLPYMAPEQILGDFVDARADLYALGCILYEIFTDQLPYCGGSVFEILDAQVKGLIRAPSELNSKIPFKLENLILNLLATDPSGRIGYASDVVMILEQLGAEKYECEEADYPSAKIYLHRSQFTGRQEIFKKFDAKMAMLPVGQGSFHCIGGESGIGKTRLALELASYAKKSRLMVLTGNCFAAAGVEENYSLLSVKPFGAFGNVFQFVVDASRESREYDLRAIVNANVKLLGRYDTAILEIPGMDSCPNPPPIPKSKFKSKLFDALKQIFSWMLSFHPVLLLIDDVQWIDSLTMEFLSSLIKENYFDTNPMQIILTYRSEEITPDIQALIESSRCEHTVLDRLSKQDIQVIVTGMLSTKRVHPALVDKLNEISGGNPFFVAEYLQACVDENILCKDHRSRWTLASQLLDSRDLTGLILPDFPDSLRQLIRHRLDILNKDIRKIADSASVLGREFEIEWLQSVVKMTRDAFSVGIQELKIRQIFEDTSPGKLRFFHDKIRETAYDSISESSRVKIHAKAANVLEKKFPDTVSRHPEEVGFHWEKACKYEEAMDYILKGAQMAYETYSLATMKQYVQRAVKILPRANLKKDKERRFMASAHRLQGQFFKMSGDEFQAISEYEKIIELGREAGDAVMEGRGFYYLGGFHLERGKLNEALKAFEKNLQLLPDEEANHYFKSNTMANIAMIFLRKGQLNQALATYESVLELMEEINHEEGLAMCYANLGLVHYYLGNFEAAFAHAETAIVKFKQLKDSYRVSNILNDLSMIYCSRGEKAKAKGSLLESLEISRKIGDSFPIAAILGNLGVLYWKTGQYWEAMESFQESLVLSRKIDDSSGIATGMLNMGSLMMELGDFDQPEDLFEDVIAQCESSEEKGLLGHAYHQYGLLYLNRFEMIPAERWLIRGHRAAVETGMKPLEIECEADLAWHTGLTGSSKVALRRIDKCLAAAASIGDADCLLRANFRAASLHLMDENAAKAKETAMRGLKIAHTDTQIDYQWRFHALLGKALLLDSNLKDAFLSFQKAFDIIRSISDSIESAFKESFLCHPEVQPAIQDAFDLSEQLNMDDSAGEIQPYLLH